MQTAKLIHSLDPDIKLVNMKIVMGDKVITFMVPAFFINLPARVK